VPRQTILNALRSCGTGWSWCCTAANTSQAPLSPVPLPLTAPLWCGPRRTGNCKSWHNQDSEREPAGWTVVGQACFQINATSRAGVRWKHFEGSFASRRNSKSIRPSSHPLLDYFLSGHIYPCPGISKPPLRNCITCRQTSLQAQTLQNN
jgi:hypothetical protein